MARGDVKPWERQPGESGPAYAAFELYRDLGPNERSLVKVARQLGKSVTLMERWSTRWSWKERVAAWDAEITRQKIAAQVKAAREMAERHAKVGLSLQKRGLELLHNLEPGSASWQDAVRLISEGVKIERVARGEPSEVVEQHHMPQFVEVVLTTEPPPEPEEGEGPDGSDGSGNGIE